MWTRGRRRCKTASGFSLKNCRRHWHIFVQIFLNGLHPQLLYGAVILQPMAGVGKLKIFIVHTVCLQCCSQAKRSLIRLNAVISAVSDDCGGRTWGNPGSRRDGLHSFDISSVFYFISRKFFSKHGTEQCCCSQITLFGITIQSIIIPILRIKAGGADCPK